MLLNQMPDMCLQSIFHSNLQSFHDSFIFFHSFLYICVCYFTYTLHLCILTLLQKNTVRITGSSLHHFHFPLHLNYFTIAICLITQHSSKWLSFLFMIDLLWMMKANVGHWSRADEPGTLKMAAILFYFLFNFSSVSFIFYFFIYMSVILAELKEWWPFWNDSQQRKIC